MTATLFIFPPSRRQDLVEHITTTGEKMRTLYQRKRYWDARCASLTKQLRKQGFTDQQISDALDDLYRGIRAERDRRRQPQPVNAKPVHAPAGESDGEARS